MTARPDEKKLELRPTVAAASITHTVTGPSVPAAAASAKPREQDKNVDRQMTAFKIAQGGANAQAGGKRKKGDGRPRGEKHKKKEPKALDDKQREALEEKQIERYFMRQSAYWYQKLKWYWYHQHLLSPGLTAAFIIILLFPYLFTISVASLSFSSTVVSSLSDPSLYKNLAATSTLAHASSASVLPSGPEAPALLYDLFNITINDTSSSTGSGFDSTIIDALFPPQQQTTIDGFCFIPLLYYLDLMFRAGATILFFFFVLEMNVPRKLLRQSCFALYHSTRSGAVLKNGPPAPYVQPNQIFLLPIASAVRIRDDVALRQNTGPRESTNADAPASRYVMHAFANGDATHNASTTGHTNAALDEHKHKPQSLTLDHAGGAAHHIDVHHHAERHGSMGSRDSSDDVLSLQEKEELERVVELSIWEWLEVRAFAFLLITFMIVRPLVDAQAADYIFWVHCGFIGCCFLILMYVPFVLTVTKLKLCCAPPTVDWLVTDEEQLEELNDALTANEKAKARAHRRHRQQKMDLSELASHAEDTDEAGAHAAEGQMEAVALADGASPGTEYKQGVELGGEGTGSPQQHHRGLLRASVDNPPRVAHSSALERSVSLSASRLLSHYKVPTIPVPHRPRITTTTEAHAAGGDGNLQSPSSGSVASPTAASVASPQHKHHHGLPDDVKDPSQTFSSALSTKLRQIIQDPKLREQFRLFLKAEFAEENLLFLVAVQDHRDLIASQAAKDKIIQSARETIQTYVLPKAPQEINVPQASVSPLLSLYRSGPSQPSDDTLSFTSPNVFDVCERSVVQLILSDVFPRFLQANRK